MSHVFYRQPRQEYPVAVAGDEIAIIDSAGQALPRRPRRGGGVVPRPQPCAGDRGDQEQVGRLAYRPHPLLHHRAGRAAGRPPDRAGAGRARAASISSPAARRPTRRRSSWRASTHVERGETAAHAISSRAGRAITATPSARSRSAATPGAPGAVPAAADGRGRATSSPATPTATRRRARATRPTAGALADELEAEILQASARGPVMRLLRRDRWSARPPARCRRRPAISSGSARSATATACCWCSTR